MNFIGIDLGTSSVKIIIMNDNGEIISSISKDYSVSYPKTGWAEQNPEDWWKATRDGIKEIVYTSNIDRNDIKGIGFSGQMHGLVLLDKNNNVLRPAILWCDQRTQKECDFLNNEIGMDKLSEFTGNMALTGFTAPKVLWVKENEPEIFEKIGHVLLPKDYIRYRLTGAFATDTSDASGTLFFDVKNRCWSQEMLKILSLKEEWLPSVFESYEVTGELTQEAAEFTGLLSGTKVVGGAGDQAAGAVGTGTVKPGIISVALGTSGVVFAGCDDFEVDDRNRLHSFCHCNGRYHQMGVMLSAASCLKWWIEDINRGLEKSSFDVFLEEAEKSPAGSNGIIFLPYLMGERTPHNNADARGVFFGMNITHKREDMTRAVLEGVAFALRDSLEILRSLNVPVDEVRVNGGGAKSILWKRILSDIFNSKVCTINSQEGPAYGAAILASVGCGRFKSVDEACEKLIRVTDTIEPVKENAAVYDKYYELFKGLYTALEGSFKKAASIKEE